MFLGEPPQTAYDLRFNLAGFQVRIHPFFWIMALIFGGGNYPDATQLLVGIPVILVSILVHELGHTFAMRYYGQHSRIVLYAFGGLAIPDGGVFDFVSHRSRKPYQQIVISAAGPLAGLGLAALTAAFVVAAGGTIRAQVVGIMPYVLADTTATIFENDAASRLISTLLFINVWWSLLNLMPVYPLDGGQIARELFIMQDPWKGLRNSVILSLVVAGAIAIWGLTSSQIFLGIMFASLAFSNWQVLQQIDGRGGFGDGGGFGGGRPW